MHCHQRNAAMKSKFLCMASGKYTFQQTMFFGNYNSYICIIINSKIINCLSEIGIDKKMKLGIIAFKQFFESKAFISPFV